MIFRYIAGNNYKNAIIRSNNIIQKGRIPVINYSIEDPNSSLTVLKEYEKLYNNIDNQYRIALKLSSFNFDLNRLNDIIEMYKTKNIKILIDAEDNSLNIVYQKIIDKLLQKHNDNECVLYKTYQMYRRDSLITLNRDIDFYMKNNLYLGIKLVRGAYWNNDIDNSLFKNKADTDNNYNKGISSIYDTAIYNNNISAILATHNSDSINIGLEYNKNKEFEFEFGHLLGMKENKYNSIEEKINVYIPYGPYHKMIPYLGRRLYENIDTIKYMI